MNPKAKPRRTIGEDPLDALLGPAQASVQASRRGLTPAEPAPRPPERPVKASRMPKVRSTYHLPANLVDELRNAVVALSGPPVRLTLARLAEEALREKLEALKKAHNNGEPFPPRAGELIGGRPIGS